MFVPSKIFITSIVLFFSVLIGGYTAITHAKNTNSGNISSKADAATKLRKKKLLHARKRVHATKLTRQKKFREKRNAAWNINRTGKTTTRKTAKRNTKRSSKSTKKSTSSYVGGRSRGISRNSNAWKCVPSRLKKVIHQISKKYGHVVINSTHRSRSKNRRSGGKRRSYHLRCQAVDFRVRGSTRGLTRWLARHPMVGGYNRYPSGFYHIDTGPKRTW